MRETRRRNVADPPRRVNFVFRAVGGGALPTEVRSAGGAARSPLWLQIKADVLGVPFRATQCPEPTSLGAAILAEAALTGVSVPEVARQWIRLGEPYLPNPDNHRRYEAMYRGAIP